MSLNLIKLCVGVDAIGDLAAWIDYRRNEAVRAGRQPEHAHVTRMMPKRAGELLDGGSLYWVIKGSVQVRQRLLDIQRITDEEGTPRCRLVLEPKLTETEWQPRRPFQGWRYLKPADAPPDLRKTADNTLPPALEAELAELGLR